MNPELLPLGVIDPRARSFIPVCREPAMATPGGSVFLVLVRGPPRPGRRYLSSASSGADLTVRLKEPPKKPTAANQPAV
jgi:hypothetical protein